MPSSVRVFDFSYHWSEKEQEMYYDYINPIYSIETEDRAYITEIEQIYFSLKDGVPREIYRR